MTNHVVALLRFYKSSFKSSWLLTLVDRAQVIIGEGVVEGDLDSRNRRSLLAALDVIEAHPDCQGLVELAVTDPSLRSWLRRDSEFFGRIRILCGTDVALIVNAGGPQVQELTRHMHNMVSSQSFGSADRRVFVASDGSAGGTDQAMGAWLSSDGVWGTLRGRGQDIFFTEMAAIHAAVHNASRYFPVVVMSDNLHSVEMINGRRSSAGLDRRCQTMLAEIRAAMGRKRAVEVVWVRGHREAGLHDGADRIARLVRRNSTGAERDRVIQAIVEESLAAHRQRIESGWDPTRDLERVG